MFSSYLCKVKSIPNIRELTFEQLSEAVADFGEKSFRAKQIYDWLWNKSARSFDQMNNVPLSLRNKLAEKFAFTPICVAHEQRSNDRTIKYGFKLHDGHLIEGVLIPTASRMTACVSSQVGCSLSCKFCATGKLDRVRNLNADEIYDQVAIIREQSMAVYNIPLSNIVYMGMGEPLLNYANVLSSIERITAANGLGMSPQRITVSTAGIAKMITKLGDDEVKFNLALSLHAANDSKRDKIMPINEHNNLEVLSDALKYFYDKTGTRVTYEFIVFNNFNDSLKDAQELAEFAKHVPCKINLIEYNAIGDGVFEKARLDRLEVFKNFLESKNLVVNIRRSRGKDIDAACGQLANKNQ